MGFLIHEANITFSHFFSGIRIHVHVTPYQIEDERRPWIKKEEKTFSDVLIKMGAPVVRKVHFANVTASLLSHFNILQEFTKAREHS